MNLEPCIKCDAGLPVHHEVYNRFHCNSCDNTAPNSYGGNVDDAGRAWNDCNTETVDHKAENEQLRADLTRTIIEAGEMMKHHTALLAHADRLHCALGALEAVSPESKEADNARSLLDTETVQSLNIIEAGAVRKAAKILCQSLAGKVLVSHTKLNDYANRLEQMK